MERRRRFEALWSQLRWLAIVAAIVMSDQIPSVSRPRLVVVILVICLYNMLASYLVADFRRFRLYWWAVSVVCRFLDAVVVTIAVAGVGPLSSSLFLAYLFVTVGGAVVFSLRWNLVTLLTCSVFYALAMGIAEPPPFEPVVLARFLSRVVLLVLVTAIAYFVTKESIEEREIRQSMERLSGLYELISERTAEVDMERMLHLILDLGMEQVDGERGSLMLLDDTGDTLHISAARGLDQEIVRETRVEKGDSISGCVAATSTPVVLGNLADDRRFSDLQGNQQILSSVSVPIRTRNRLLGVLNVGTTGLRDPFSDEDLRLLMVFAAHAATALENAKLFTELRTQAETDMLTGLYNRRYFDTRIATECRRAHRYGYSFTLLMFDIDNFKYYNDQYGHRAGDEILSQIGGIIESSFRDSDTKARYGGEEFCVMLPHTDLEGGMCVSERLRAKVADYPFRADLAEGGHRVTISGGVAVLSQEEPSSEALVNQADRAMLAGKKSGKNIILSHEPAARPKEETTSS